MGLRAFSSQLLCEQVVGRGLRRASYEINEETGLFDPEYVNVFGVPLAFCRTNPRPVIPHRHHLKSRSNRLKKERDYPFNGLM